MRLKHAIALGVPCIAVFGVFLVAEAYEVVYTQPLEGVPSTYEKPTGSANNLAFRLKQNGITGYPAAIEFRAITDVSDTNFTFQLEEYNDSNFSSFSESWVAPGSCTFVNLDASLGYHLCNNIASTTWSFDPAKYYRFQIGLAGGGGEVRMYGAPSTASTTQAWCDVRNSLYRLCDGLDSPYFELYTNEGGAPATTTRIVSVASPGESETTGSTSVLFEFDYWRGLESYDRAGVEITRLDVGQNILVPEEPIIASGLSTYSETITLSAGGVYYAQYYLRDTSGVNQTIRAFPRVFYVVENPGGYELIDENATTTAQVSGILYALTQKAPLVWYFQVRNAIVDASDETGGGTPSITLHFASSTDNAFDWTIDAQDGVDAMGAMHAVLYALAVAGIWLWVAMSAYGLVFRAF